MKKGMKEIFFFIGTEAEFIKVFPVIIEAQNKGAVCHIIASGQNDLKKSRILEYIALNGKYIELSSESDIKKSKSGLFSWFIRTGLSAKRNILRAFRKEELFGRDMVVHGDTISTVMGAYIGHSFHMRVCHVEAGLRSHNFFNPFPEEIDRILTSKVTRIHFAPGKAPSLNLLGNNNAKRVRGKVVNTGYNTILDSLRISKKMPIITEGLEKIIDDDYFVFVMHRQENIINTDFFIRSINNVIKIASERKCVLILHKITENKLDEVGLLEVLNSNNNFILLQRVDYFDFMKLLDKSQFVITDGGSNQEELHYMGKPCLIMRKNTERNEGIGQNAKLYGNDVDEILRFSKNYDDFCIDGVDEKISPSSIICKYLTGER